VNASSPIGFPSFRGDPINLLWLLPLTGELQQSLQQNKVSANELIGEICGERKG